MRQFCSSWLIFFISMNNNFCYFFMFFLTLMHIYYRFMVKYAVAIHIQLWFRIGIQVKSWMQREWRLRTRGMRSNGYVRIENGSGNIREDWECMVLRGVLITRDNYVYCTYKESRASCKSNLRIIYEWDSPLASCCVRIICEVGRKLCGNIIKLLKYTNKVY